MFHNITIDTALNKNQEILNYWRKFLSMIVIKRNSNCAQIYTHIIYDVTGDGVTLKMIKLFIFSKKFNMYHIITSVDANF